LPTATATPLPTAIPTPRCIFRVLVDRTPMAVPAQPDRQVVVEVQVDGSTRLERTVRC
jgi:hypothetical protein